MGLTILASGGGSVDLTPVIERVTAAEAKAEAARDLALAHDDTIAQAVIDSAAAAALAEQVADLAQQLANVELTPGDPGESAYQIARRHGYGGTETQWIASLTGGQGASAYDLARQQGYGGTLTQWLASLNGSNGASAYQLAQQQGYTGTLDQWLASLVGAPGSSGTANLAIAARPVAALSLNQTSVAIVMPWSKALSTNTYTAHFIHTSATAQSNYSVSVTTRTTTSVTVTVKALVALGAGTLLAVTY